MIAKTIAFATAILAAGAAFAAQPAEGDYPRSQSSSPAAPGARAQVAAEAARWNLAGQPGQVMGEHRPQFTPAYDDRSKGRAAVIADRDTYARSGAMRIGNDG